MKREDEKHNLIYPRLRGSLYEQNCGESIRDDGKIRNDSIESESRRCCLLCNFRGERFRKHFLQRERSMNAASKMNVSQ